LYGCNLKSQCEIRLAIRSDDSRGDACFRAKIDGDGSIDVLAATMFSDILTDLGGSSDFFFLALQIP
jgi:hypothetical protein